LVVPLIFFWKWRQERHLLPRTLLDWALALLLIQMFINCFVVLDLSFSLPKIAGALFGILLFYALVGVFTHPGRSESRKRIKFFVLIFILGASLLTLISFIGMKFTQEAMIHESYSALEKAFQGWREVAPLVDWHLPGAEEGFNPNAVGGTSLLSLPLIFLVSLFFLGKNNEQLVKRKTKNKRLKENLIRIFIIIVWSVFLIILFLTQSMGSWIALLVAFWIIGLARNWPKKWLIVATLMLALFISWPAGGEDGSSYQNWVKKKWETRKPLLLTGLAVARERPLTGIGMNQLRKLTVIKYEQSTAHNHFIHTAAELGIPGLVAYLALLVGAGFMCVEVWRKGRDEFMRMSVLGLGAGQVAHFIFGMGDSIPLGAKVGFVFWVSLALITGIYNYTFHHEFSPNKPGK